MIVMRTPARTQILAVRTPSALEERATTVPAKPDWQQWVPLYGLGRAAHDMARGEPTIADGGFAGKYFLRAAMVHALPTATALVALHQYLR